MSFLVHQHQERKALLSQVLTPAKWKLHTLKILLRASSEMLNSGRMALKKKKIKIKSLLPILKSLSPDSLVMVRELYPQVNSLHMPETENTCFLQELKLLPMVRVPRALAVLLPPCLPQHSQDSSAGRGDGWLPGQPLFLAFASLL